MKILIVSATKTEIQPIIDYFGDNRHVDHLVTGVGMVATAFSLGHHFAKQHDYDLVLNAGIGGVFDRNIALGEVVIIKEDTFSEFGAEDGEGFLTMENLGFGPCTFYSIDANNVFSKLKKVSAITVNQVHGNDASIKKITERLHPQLESMEGAAFFFACHQHQIPCFQIRAASNYVETRNRENWKIELAIHNLNKLLIEFIINIK